MKLLEVKFLLALLAVAIAEKASAGYLTCSATVNGGASTVVDQFPASLDYELTVTEAFVTWCNETQPSEAWCHTIPPASSASLLVSEADAVLEALLGAPIPWVTTTHPSWMFGGELRATPVSFTVDSYADCATRARDLPTPALPDANGVVTVDDHYVVQWGTDGVPPYYAECSARIECVPPQGQTRTLGYFKTHPAAVDACLSHGSVDLGFLSVSSSSVALGLLHASPAKYADGARRTGFDQARLLLARQLLVATCNVRVFGSTPVDAGLIGDSATALAGTSCNTMSWIQGQLDAFNNSGDTGENHYGSASPGIYADPTIRTSGTCQ